MHIYSQTGITFARFTRPHSYMSFTWTFVGGGGGKLEIESSVINSRW